MTTSPLPHGRRKKVRLFRFPRSPTSLPEWQLFTVLSKVTSGRHPLSSGSCARMCSHVSHVSRSDARWREGPLPCSKIMTRGGSLTLSRLKLSGRRRAPPHELVDGGRLRYRTCTGTARSQGRANLSADLTMPACFLGGFRRANLNITHCTRYNGEAYSHTYRPER